MNQKFHSSEEKKEELEKKIDEIHEFMILRKKMHNTLGPEFRFISYLMR